MVSAGMRHIYIVLLLLAAMTFSFVHRGGREDVQPPGDDPAYVQSAYDYWHKGAYPGSITWSPGYVQLMSPFVGLLGKEAGYKAWRFVLFTAVSLAIYAVFAQMTSSLWSGAVLAILFQLMLMPYLAPSLQTMVCLVYLLCLFLLTGGPKYVGLVFAFLLNGIYISGAMSFVLFSFGVACLLFRRELILNKRFWLQFSLGVAVFAAVLNHFSYDVRQYSEEAAQRGRAGLYHQLSQYIVSSGRSAPYLTTEEADPKRVFSSEYERHLKAADRYYLATFGETENDLRSYRHGASWPLFLLDWPWLIEKEPALMKGYALDVLKTLMRSVLGSFQVVNPFTAYRLDDYKVTDTTSFIKRAVFNIGAVLLLQLMLVLPGLIARLRKQATPDLPAGPSRLQALFVVSTLAAIVPLMLVKPLAIYFPPFIPAYLTALVLLAGFMSRMLVRRAMLG